MVRVATNQTPHGLPSPSASPSPLFNSRQAGHLPDGVDYTGFHGTDHMHGSDGKCYGMTEHEQPCPKIRVIALNGQFQSMRAAQIKLERARMAELQARNEGGSESESDDEDIPVGHRLSCQHCGLKHEDGQDPCVSSPEESEEEFKPFYTKENPKILPHGAIAYYEGRKPQPPVVSKFSPESSDDEGKPVYFGGFVPTRAKVYQPMPNIFVRADDSSYTASVGEDSDDDSDKENITPPPEEATVDDLRAEIRQLTAERDHHVEMVLDMERTNGETLDYVEKMSGALQRWKAYSESGDDTLDEMIGYLQDARDSVVNCLNDFSPKIARAVEESPLEDQPRIAAKAFHTIVVSQAELIKRMRRKLMGRQVKEQKLTCERLMELGKGEWLDVPNGLDNLMAAFNARNQTRPVRFARDLRVFNGMLQKQHPRRRARK
jgi:hypothetical protein